ncbi:MAG: 5'-nucleotidase C-terminal domain-containing protein [Desulfomonile tiedjei]|nr:5'-nucleotidase C-terminal domain-containing protein [Desulfomonile tiedjei]
MRSVRHRFPALLKILIVLAFAASTCAWTGTEAGAQPLKLTILHMNDAHAHYLPYEEKGSEGLIGGFAKARTVIAREQAKAAADGRKTLIFYGGDLLMGTPFSTAFKGELGVKLMNMMGFNAMVVGNHEFDYGQENILSRLKPTMGFPLLSANTKTKAGQGLFDRMVVKEIPEAKAKVVVFGLTTVQTPETTHPRNVKGLLFEDPVATAKKFVSGRSNDGLIIALTHLGVEEDKRLAGEVPQIGLIIGGHSHTALFKPLKVGNTLICQAGAYAKYVGKLDADVVDGKIVKYHGELIPLTAAIKEDPEVSGVITEYKAKLDNSLKTVIGKTEVYLEGGRSAVRSDRETNLGKLITYNMAVNAASDAAVVNGGSIRSSLNVGDITLNDVYTVLPFPATVVRMALQGEDLAAVLQRSADLGEGSGGKLQTFGITYQIDQGKVRIQKIRGHQFEPTETYSVAINDFLAAGGDGYTLFKEKGTNVYESGILVSDILIDYIKNAKAITQSTIDELR